MTTAARRVNNYVNNYKDESDGDEPYDLTGKVCLDYSVLDNVYVHMCIV